MGRFSTFKEAAGELKVSVPTLRAWKKNGMPVHYFSWLIRVDLTEVLAWLETYKPQRRLTLEQARATTCAEHNKTHLEPKDVPLRRPISSKP